MIQYIVCLCSSCGLAEELAQGTEGQQKANLPKSSCGSVSIFTFFFFYSQVLTLFPHISSIILTTIIHCWQCEERMVSMNFISICGSVTLVMHSDVPAVRTRGCQLSNQEKRSCWTRRRWRMLETLHFTHPTAHASKPHIPFFSFHPWRHDCLCKNTEMKAAFSVYMRWGVCACFCLLSEMASVWWVQCLKSQHTSFCFRSDASHVRH